MNQSELKDAIVIHEMLCNVDPETLFQIVGIKQIAPGVLVAKEASGTHAIYFDKSRYSFRKDMTATRGSPRDKHLRQDVGHVHDRSAKTTQEITVTARMCLWPAKGGFINWVEPTKVAFTSRVFI